MSLKTIAEGFTHLLFTNADIERVANARANICNNCPVSEYGKSRYCKLTNGGCGCYLPAKRRAMSEECPLKKWNSVNDATQIEGEVTNCIMELWKAEIK